MCWLEYESELKPGFGSTISVYSESPLPLIVKGTEDVKGPYTLFILHPNNGRQHVHDVHVQRKEYVLSEVPGSATSRSHQASVCLFVLNNKELLQKKCEGEKKQNKTEKKPKALKLK